MMILAGVMEVGHILAGFGGDAMIGVIAMFTVVALLDIDVRQNLVKKLAGSLSDMSYTIYLTHFPFLAFLFFVYFRGHRVELTGATLLEFLALFASVVLVAYPMWWVFERNTDRIRYFAKSILEQWRRA